MNKMRLSEGKEYTSQNQGEGRGEDESVTNKHRTDKIEHRNVGKKYERLRRQLMKK